MITLREWVTRLWGTFRPSRRDADLEQELRLHLDLAAEHERRRTDSSDAARRAAVIRLGGVAQAMEAVRDQRGLPWLDDLARDLRHGLRTLRRNPMFATVTLLTLAIGIGANTAVFSVVNSVLLMEGIPANWDAIRAEGQTYDEAELPPLRVFKSISPAFFQTTGTRLIAGREYTWTDLYGRRPVVMVSENLARELWGMPSDAVGKRIQAFNGPWREVIGVVQDVRDNGVHEPAPAIVYWPSVGESYYRAGQTSLARTVTFAIRSGQAGTDTFLSEVRESVWAVNASLPLASVRTMQELYEQSMARTSFTLVMLATAAIVALVLGLVGIYGVISYAVSQRTREIGIRLALGAQQAELKRMFVRYGLVLAGIGVGIGLGAAAGRTRLMSSLLFGISPLDPMTYLAVPLVLVVATILASYLPARRVAAVDPVEALKVE